MSPGILSRRPLRCAIWKAQQVQMRESRENKLLTVRGFDRPLDDARLKWTFINSRRKIELWSKLTRDSCLKRNGSVFCGFKIELMDLPLVGKHQVLSVGGECVTGKQIAVGKVRLLVITLDWKLEPSISARHQVPNP